MRIEKIGLSVFVLVYFINVILEPHNTQWVAAGEAAALIAAVVYVPLRLLAWVVAG